MNIQKEKNQILQTFIYATAKLKKTFELIVVRCKQWKEKSLSVGRSVIQYQILFSAGKVLTHKTTIYILLILTGCKSEGVNYQP